MRNIYNMETKEIWKPLEGFDGLYEVSNMGKVRSLKRKIDAPYLINQQKKSVGGIILKPTIDKDGYERVNIHTATKRKNFYVHVAVAKAFIPNEQNKPFIDHINCNRRDNRTCNLRWVTAKENQNNLLTRQHLKKGKEKTVVMYDLCNTPIKAFHSAKMASFILGCSIGHLQQACRKNGIFKSYKWAYAESPSDDLFDAPIPFMKKQRIKAIEQVNADGEKIACFPNIREAARKYGFSEGHLNDAIHGKIKMAYGFIWRYEEDALFEAEKQIALYEKYL